MTNRRNIDSYVDDHHPDDPYPMHLDPEPIICIGVFNGVTVNAYRTYHNELPIVELFRPGQRLTLNLAQTEGVIDLLQEALAFWQEEGE